MAWRASTLAASTLGWSKGLMPRRWPATAVAISHRKNCSPRVVQIAQAQANHRLPGVLQSLHGGIVGVVSIQPQVDEEAVVAVHGR